MPLKLDSRDRKLFIAAGVVFVLLIVVAVIFGGDAGQDVEIPSTYSTASTGAKAAYLLLLQGGYNQLRWEKSLSQLPRGAGKTLILASPFEAPTREERERLRTFIEEGGHVIATGMAAGTFLPESSSVPDPLSGMLQKTMRAEAPSEITKAAPEIVMAPQAHWLSGTAYRLYSDGEQAVVVKYLYGRGQVLWWAAATPLTNAGLTDTGNLEFFLACLGGTKNQILWDEYIHGYRETLASSIAHSPVKWLVLQLSLLALAVLATFSRRSGPVFKPAAEMRLSPLEFVNTLGGLYERGGTAAVAVDICYQRFRYWLARRLGVANNVSINDLVIAVRERWSLIDDHFAAILRRCESARNDPYLHGQEALHLVQELDEYAIKLRLFEGVRKEKMR